MPLYTQGLKPPNLPSGYYFYTTSPDSVGTSATQGNGTLRVMPWIVYYPLSITRLGAEVVTIGDVGSKVRLGIYTDDGSGRPASLVVDAGQIAGDSATVQELTVSTTLAAGIYWIGGAVQSAASTQPTLRLAANWTPPIPVPASTAIPSANGFAVGWTMTGVTAALPSTFTVAASATGCVRVFAKVA